MTETHNLPAGPVYVAYSAFTGSGATLKSDIITVDAPVFMLGDARSPDVVLGAAAVLRRPVEAKDLWITAHGQ